MASTEEKQTKKLGMKDDSTGNHSYRVKVEKRTCQKVLRKKYCTPWVYYRLDLHFEKTIAEQIVTLGAGAGSSAAVVLAGTASAATGGITAGVTLLATILLHFARNPDGSLDVSVDNAGVSIDGKYVPTPPGQTTQIMWLLGP